MSTRIIKAPSTAENIKIAMAAKADPNAQKMSKAQFDSIAPLRIAHNKYSINTPIASVLIA